MDAGEYMINGNKWKVHGWAGRWDAWTEYISSVFHLRDRESTFMFEFNKAFGALVEAHVAGSYPLWCMLDRPDTWSPGDIDVYLTDRVPILYDLVFAWVSKYPGSKVDASHPGKIDVCLEESRFPVSLIFQSVSDAMQQFDLSVCSVGVPVNALWQDESTCRILDRNVLADIAGMCTRAHSSIVKNVLAKPADVVWPSVQHERLGKHLALYISRGFTAVPDGNPARLTPVAWDATHGNRIAPDLSMLMDFVTMVGFAGVRAIETHPVIVKGRHKRPRIE